MAAKNHLLFQGTLLVLFSIYGVTGGAENGKNSKVDARADSTLKAMSSYMSTLPQFSFLSTRTIETTLKSQQKIQYVNSGFVYVRRPDKLRADLQGDPMNPDSVTPLNRRVPLNASLFYNSGSLITYKKNYPAYATANVPAIIDSAIVYAEDCLHLSIPAAVLLYKDNYGALMNDVKSGVYLGQTMIDSFVCSHLAFRRSDTDWQIWIENGATPLPLRYVVTSRNKSDEPDFNVTFSQWNTTSTPPDSLFTFKPPQGVAPVNLQPTKCKEKSK